jgi:hypothetical protein
MERAKSQHIVQVGTKCAIQNRTNGKICFRPSRGLPTSPKRVRERKFSTIRPESPEFGFQEHRELFQNPALCHSSNSTNSKNRRIGKRKSNRFRESIPPSSPEAHRRDSFRALSHSSIRHSPTGSLFTETSS